MWVILLVLCGGDGLLTTLFRYSVGWYCYESLSFTTRNQNENKQLSRRLTLIFHNFQKNKKSILFQSLRDSEKDREKGMYSVIQLSLI